MRPYEIVIIFDATLEEPVIAEITDRVVETVRDKGGRPGHVDRWGRRPFAYELKHRSEGYYVVIELVAEPGTVAEIDRLLSLSDDVLRHRVVRRPEGADASSSERVGPKPAPSAANVAR